MSADKAAITAIDQSEVVEALRECRTVLRHGSSQSARMLLGKIDAALARHGEKP